jgi:hypothetical protein
VRLLKLIDRRSADCFLKGKLGRGWPMFATAVERLTKSDAAHAYTPGMVSEASRPNLGSRLTKWMRQWHAITIATYREQ